jgi:hypothetical protein
MGHLQDRHDMDVRVSEVTCPLCEEFTSGDHNVLSLHIARHMEEIALAILPSGVDSDEESVDDSSIHSDSSKGHEKMSYASLDELDPYWMQFNYSRDGVVTNYTIRTDIEEVDVECLPHGFKMENCIYPRALVPRDQYKGSDLDEKTCNDVGWALAELNPSLRGHRGVLQTAVERMFGVLKTDKKHKRDTAVDRVLNNPPDIQSPWAPLTTLDWESRKQAIVRLYVTENRSLSEVCQTMERLFGFVATYVDHVMSLSETNNSVRHSQYKTRFRTWGLLEIKKHNTETVAGETAVSSLSENSGSASPRASSVAPSEGTMEPITEAASRQTLQLSKVHAAMESKEGTSKFTRRGCPGGNWTCKPIDVNTGARWTSLKHFREHYTTYHLEEHRRDDPNGGKFACHLCESAAFPRDGYSLTMHIFYNHLQS